MNTLFKLTLVAGVVASAFNIPAPAEAGLFSGLRGMFAPQSSVSDFEGRFVQSQGHNAAWQHAPAQHAQSSYHTSNYVPLSARPTEPGVRYYTSQEYYGRKQHQTAPKKFGLGYGNIYDYESGRCGSACARPAPTRTYVARPAYVPRQTYQQTYRQITQYKCWNGQIVSNADGCPDQTITETIPQFRCWDGEVVTDENGCRPQTITREVAVSSSNNYISTPSYSSSTETANCPSGTAKQTDGTCLEISSSPITSYDSSSSYSSSSSYGSGSTYSGSIPTNCPAGTTAQSDGTCLEGGSTGFTGSNDYSSPYAGSSVELFSTPEPTTTPEYGYISDGVYGATDYPPLRK